MPEAAVSFNEIGHAMGMSRQQAELIHNRALRKLAAQYPDAWAVQFRE